jgi:hypothetical protein
MTMPVLRSTSRRLHSAITPWRQERSDHQSSRTKIGEVRVNARVDLSGSSTEVIGHHHLGTVPSSGRASLILLYCWGTFIIFPFITPAKHQHNSRRDATYPTFLYLQSSPHPHRSVYFKYIHCQYGNPIRYHAAMSATTSTSYLAGRPMALAVAKLFFLALAQLPVVQAIPLHVSSILGTQKGPEPKEPDDPSLWLYLGVAAALVLLGGAFAGLTIALMGQVRSFMVVVVSMTLMLHRMRYICKLSKHLGKARRRNMQRRYLDC